MSGQESLVIGQQSAEETAIRQQVKQMLQLRSVVRVWYCGLQGWGIVVSSRGVDPNYPHEITVRTATGDEVDVPWKQCQPETDPDILKCAEEIAQLWWGAQPLTVAHAITDVPREESRAEGAEGAEMIATIRYKPLSEGRPAFGHTVGIWMQAFKIVIRGYRDARAETDWRVAGTDGMPIDERYITGWTELPAGCLPPPDQGGAA